MLGSQQLLFILDKVGIVAFAFTAVSLGVKKKLDIFGLLLLGIISAIGGGVIRDLFLARIPFAISHIDYLGYAYGASILSIVIFSLGLKINKRIIIFCDTVGLGVFAAAGATVSITAHLSIFHTILFAIITAVGGGIVRDMLINEIPFILKTEIYATAAGLGGLVVHISYFLGLNAFYAVLVGMIVTIVVRLYSIKRNVNLPVLRSKILSS